jgi:hypothetical protein
MNPPVSRNNGLSIFTEGVPVGMLSRSAIEFDSECALVLAGGHFDNRGAVKIQRSVILKPRSVPDHVNF